MLKVAYKKGIEDEQVQAKKLPMYKDPVFMARLRQEFISDHNRKLRDRKVNQVNK